MPSRSRLARWLLIAAAVFTAAGSRPLQAQGSPLNIVPGTRVRVTAVNLLTPLVANFLAIRGDSVDFIEVGGGRSIWTVALVDIRKLEKSDGERVNNKPYMLRGAAFGAPIGLLGGLIFANNADPSDSAREYNKVGMGTISLFLGAGIGAAIGSRFAIEKWTDVPVRRVAVAPFLGPNGRSRGITASVSLAF